MAQEVDNLENNGVRIMDKSLEDVMHSSMMPYSEYVILERALPRVEDGLKPVQRRILYSMIELGLTPDKQYKKSARVVGDCLGKYHPHGDTSIYGAMVRMAQPFNQSEILVDGHGNFGSVDGDGAAAMRYTEVRLMPIALELLRDIEKDTVNWTFNFDDTLKEPATLPGRFPNLLVNGAYGIAVGLATNIPPHNVTETIDGVIAYIDNPKITLPEMMNYIKAPDFPTGGYILVDDELTKAYETGRGKIIIRAKFNVEKDGDKRSIIITELPYQVNKTQLLIKIDALRESKKELYCNIADILDESDRDGMRAVIKLKREADAPKIIKSLLKDTEMQVSFGINMVAIANGKPQQMGILQIIKYYVEYQRQVVFKRTQFDLAAAKAREHILIGLAIACKNIDEVVKIIKASASVTDCKQRLRERFDLSEKQAQAILDMRLGRLVKLEVIRIEEELKELAILIKELSEIVASKIKQFNLVKKELLEVRKIFKRERRTVIVRNGVEEARVEEIDINYVEEKSGIAILTQANYIKFLSNKAYNLATKDCSNCSGSDIVVSAKACNNQTPLYGFTDLGNCVKIDVNDLSADKWRHKGTALTKIAAITKDERVINIFTEDELKNNKILFLTSGSYCKVTSGSEYLIDKKQYQAITMKAEDERVLSVELKRDDMNIFMATRCGMCLNMEADIPVQGRRSSGVIGIQLADDDSVQFAFQIGSDGEIAVITDAEYAKRVIISTIKDSKRNRKGIKLQDLNVKSGNSLVYVGYVDKPHEIALIGESGTVVGVNTDDLSLENTVSKGRIMKNISGVIAKAAKHNLI